MIKRILLSATCMLALASPVMAAAPTQADLDAARTRATQTPESADAQFELAMAYARTPFLEQGWEALKRVNALDPGYADKAVAKYEAAIAASPADPEAHFRLAFAYYFQNKKDQARAQMEQVVALAPQDPWGYDYLGFLIAEQDQTQLDEPTRLWRKALELDPNNAVAHYLIGQVYYRQGKFLQAAGAIGSALKARASSGLSP